MVVVDITGVVSDDEHIQVLGFRDVLKEMFADNPIALKNLEATLSNDDEKCVEWYFDTLKGKVNQQRDIISKNIYPISEEERNEMRNRIYACLPKPEPVKGIKETLNSLKGRKDIDVVYVSAGSSGRKKNLSVSELNLKMLLMSMLMCLIERKKYKKSLIMVDMIKEKLLMLYLLPMEW